MKGDKKMIVIDENKLSNGTLIQIGEDYGISFDVIKCSDEKEYFAHVNKIVEMLQIQN